MKKIFGSALILLAVCSSLAFASGSSASSGLKIAMLPKFKGENYFDAVKVGAQEAVDELNKGGAGIQFLYDGPTQDQATNQKQVDILEGWIAQKVSVIIVSPNDPTAIAPTLKRAQSQGIKVLTYDADAQADARDLFVNQVVSAGVAQGLVKSMADKLQAKGYGPSKTANLAIVSSAKTDANQQEWLAEVKKLLASSQYSWMVIRNEDTDVYYPGPDETNNLTQSGTVIGRMGPGADQIQGAIGLTSMSVPALGSQYEAASQKPDPTKVAITGLATPNAIKSYIKSSSNPLDAGVLWNCMDLGYLAIQSGYQMSKGTITGSSASVTAGRLGAKDIANKMVVLGPALVFDAANVDKFNY
ncbi:autoinducer 2 ABC transporter substrate-binding protein [Leadbettera azotonutricia]|uniref:Inner-membrane translocator n=1 Tax=Leadbettera azotonutricia (strain ATCC BAA-888 / DSM 13862 / ZAS-9) TaxID=545695 RepID=F5YG50_LEAAZ|nr:autoinducer 2 ABC transporter substrate-binding protein [Leadbettera azotonutricia]AEF81223.1 inner-membrane translocator [Leadbettera azotonutricia ZAS-9]